MSDEARRKLLEFGFTSNIGMGLTLLMLMMHSSIEKGEFPELWTLCFFGNLVCAVFAL